MPGDERISLRDFHADFLLLTMLQRPQPDGPPAKISTVNMNNGNDLLSIK
jgi:hypothetical protein